MHKQVTAMLCSILALFFCCAGAPDYDNTTEPDYVQDGLEKYVSESEMAEEVSDVRKQLDPFVTYSDGTLSFHIDEARNATSFADEVYTGVRFNVELMNKLANSEMRAAYINHKKELVYLIDDEYKEEWQQWKIGVHWWGVTYKLDSDFGKLVGIGGMVYRLAAFLSNAFSFYQKIMRQTDYDTVTSVIATAVFNLPPSVLKDVVSTYLENHISVLVSGLITANLALMTLEKLSPGYGWLVKTVLNAILSKIAPTLITSCTIIYNCFRLDCPVFCQIRFWGIRWSLTQLD